MDVRRSRFLTSASANWAAVAAPVAVSFLLTPYLMAKLGAARYGVWCVVEAVLAYLTVLDLGVAACLVRAVARGRTVGDRDGVARTASACLAVFAAAGVVALLVGAPVLLAMAPRLTRAAGDPDVPAFALLMLLNMALALPLGVFPTVLDGLERFGSKSLVRVVCLFGRTAGLVWVMETSAGLLPMAGVYTVALLVEHLLMAVVCFRALPGLRLHWRLVDRATLRTVRTSSTDAFLAMVAGRVTGYTGAIVVGMMLRPELAGVFANAARLVNQAKDLLRAVTATLAPGVSAMEARGDHDGVRRLFLTATRWVLYLVVPVNLGLWCFGQPFLVRWLGPEAGAATFPPAAVLALTLTVGVAQSAASRILYGLGELRWFARLTLLDGAVNLLLTLALVRPFGVEGVAWAVAVPNLVVCALVIDHTRRRLGVAAGDYLRVWVRPLACGLVPLAVWLLVGRVEPAWGAVAVGIGLGLVPYAVAVVFAERLVRLPLPRFGGEGRGVRGFPPSARDASVSAAGTPSPRPSPPKRGRGGKKSEGGPLHFSKLTPGFPPMPLLLLALALSPPADWREFRGPDGTGLYTGPALPTEWGPDKNVLWATPVSGKGWSSPILVDGKLILTTAVPLSEAREADQSLRALAFDFATGKPLWDVELVRAPGDLVAQKHKKNGDASPTPVSDGKTVVCHFGHMGTAAVDLAGKVLWTSRELAYKPLHGNGASPILADDLVIVPCDGQDVAFVAALDLATGKERWRTERKTNARMTFSFATPHLVTGPDGKRVLVSPASDYCMGYDPKTGAELWRCKYPQPGWSLICRPVFAHGLVYVPTGYVTPHVLAIDPFKTGDVQPAWDWKVKMYAPNTPTPLILGDELYLIGDMGYLSVVDARTGKTHYTERLAGKAYSASPIAADGKLWLTSEDGVGQVVAAGTEFKEVSRSELKEKTFATFVPAAGNLVVRTESKLYRFGTR